MKKDVQVWCNTPKKKEKEKKEGYLSKFVYGDNFIINNYKGAFQKIRLKP